MRVSQRLDYSLRLLIALAQQPAGQLAGAGELADRLGLPRRFLELQATALAKRGLVECRRGTGGGCALARPAAEITLAEVVAAVEGVVFDAPRTPGLASSEAWQGAGLALRDHLVSIDLGTLAARQSELDEADTPMYFI